MAEIWRGYALWHEHFFGPDGGSFPGVESAPEEINEVVGRYDAIEEDVSGRIFVWSAESMEIVEVCINREEACRRATARATW